MINPNMESSRPAIEAEIERLIDLLDTLDRDPDLESTADEEPWLGAANPSWNYYTPSIKLMINKHQRSDLWAGMSQERTRETSQASWCSNGCSDDREIEFDNEPDRDGEGTSNYAGPCSA